MQIHLGKYVARTKSGVLIDPETQRPVPWPAEGMPPWLDARRVPGQAGGTEALVKIRAFEEKGSDVNAAVALLMAAMGGAVDAAIVMSNDSDLSFALDRVRRAVPLGVLNPGRRRTAADLRGNQEEGVGGHWWGRIVAEDYLAAQMPTVVGPWSRPVGW